MQFQAFLNPSTLNYVRNNLSTLSYVSNHEVPKEGDKVRQIGRYLKARHPKLCLLS